MKKCQRCDRIKAKSSFALKHFNFDSITLCWIQVRNYWNRNESITVLVCRCGILGLRCRVSFFNQQNSRSSKKHPHLFKSIFRTHFLNLQRRRIYTSWKIASGLLRHGVSMKTSRFSWSKEWIHHLIRIFLSFADILMMEICLLCKMQKLSKSEFIRFRQCNLEISEIETKMKFTVFLDRALSPAELYDLVILGLKNSLVDNLDKAHQLVPK